MIRLIFNELFLFSDVTSILLRITEEFRLQLSHTSGTDHSETKTDKEKQVGEASESETDKHRDLVQGLVQLMEQLVKAGKTPVLVIDGLDKVKRGKLEKVSVNPTFI